MTIPWPNAAVVGIQPKHSEVEIELASTPKELVRTCLAHTQFCLGFALLQFHQLVFLLTLGLNDDFDFSQSDQAFETLQHLTSGFAVLSLITFVLCFWFFAKSIPIMSSKSCRKHAKELWSRDTTSRWMVATIAIGLVAFGVTYFLAFWLDSNNLISKSMKNTLRVVSHLSLGGFFIVAASLRIKQAIKFLLDPAATN